MFTYEKKLTQLHNLFIYLTLAKKINKSHRNPLSKGLLWLYFLLSILTI